MSEPMIELPNHASFGFCRFVHWLRLREPFIVLALILVSATLAIGSHLP